MTLKNALNEWVWALVTINPGLISTPWKKNADGTESCMHYTDQNDDAALDKDMMIRHCFLEVLDLLGVIEYSKGYDSAYHDVTITRIK